MTTSRAALARATRSSRLALSLAGPERDIFLLLCKAALATVLAWQFAVRVLHSPTPFYAPMAALLVVDRTMVRSLLASVQRIAAVVLGMSVAWAVGSVAGVSWWSIGPVIFFALLLGRWSRRGDRCGHQRRGPCPVAPAPSSRAGCRPGPPGLPAPG
jgi:Aromatic acid exporter family member 1